MKNFYNPSLALACGLLAQATVAYAQTPASAPYTPTWQVRHHLQWLADNAALPITVTHWPLPAAAVQQALDALPLPAQADNARNASDARDFVLKELASLQSRGQMQLQLRQRAEGLPGFDEQYTPGSSVQLVSSEKRMDGDTLSLAGRLGVRLEESSNSLTSNATGLGTEGRYQLRAEGSAAVLGWSGWNVQAFSHRHWWGPGWQSSLIIGSNSSTWNGLGLQRGTTQPSTSPWLSWMGPWSLDVFVARAQDPLVVTGQPQGYLFSGMRLTMKPMPWLEVGLSRSLQTGGAGRPSGAGNFVKAFLGREVNREIGDPPDSSNQIAGFDARARCPLAWGQCAAYTQWMGEDAAGSWLPVPVPFKFMHLWGVDHTYAQGRYRVFAEYANTNMHSLPLLTESKGPGYINGVYNQGYTHGGRWIGSAQGGGSQVTTLGWMDAQSRRMVKVHAGKVLYGVGAAYPGGPTPHGQLRGISAIQVLHWQGLVLTPELSWTRLSEGQDTGANQNSNLRLGLTLRMPLERF